MKIGMIVFSHTGNTLSVAQKLQEKLAAAGHPTAIERLKPVGEVKSDATDCRFESLPDTGKYDALVLCSPVLAFSLSPIMKSYLTQCAAFTGRKAALLVTQAFPFPWMGGNQAISRLKRACESKGAAVLGSGIVNWSRKGREKQIEEVVDRLGALFR